MFGRIEGQQKRWVPWTAWLAPRAVTLQSRRNFPAPGISSRIAVGVVTMSPRRIFKRVSVIGRFSAHMEGRGGVFLGQKISQSGGHLSGLYSIPWSLLRRDYVVLIGREETSAPEPGRTRIPKTAKVRNFP
jgi:hypothetical protein